MFFLSTEVMIDAIVSSPNVLQGTNRWNTNTVHPNCMIASAMSALNVDQHVRVKSCGSKSTKAIMQTFYFFPLAIRCEE